MSLMASPSSLPSRNWSYNVFASFHGPDVRKTLLSHLREQFKRNGITMFDDQGIERSATIAPSLTKAIRESRISIVILSKKYASSSWCLNELVEILECKNTLGQIVMTIFYGVDPSHVRKQTGEFGIAFDETCEGKTEEERQKWSQALIDVGNIAGEDFFRWDNEANMIKKIARDVSDKLNATPSRDFDGMVGLEHHLRRMESLLDLDYDGVKMVAITGPAGIGKTTIARALQSQLSGRFQLTCFMDNLRGSYQNGTDEYGLKLRLQEQLLSSILSQNGIRICNLGVIQERLCKHRVLIILDDVNHIKQLEALAGDISWFGPGSRIVVTTENKELLQQHGINNTYHVGFPSREEALEILRRYAFRQSYPHNGFEKHAESVAVLCGNLPLGLRVVGSSLRGKEEDEWDETIRRLETNLDHEDIKEVLKFGYESLHEDEQTLFLHIAVFFNRKDSDLLEAMFAGNNLNIKHGLKILIFRSLIEISTEGEIVMHKLLQQVGRHAIKRQEPWTRKILIDAQEICDVLENAKGTRAVSGISFDISGIDEVSINERAFKGMPNLRFLKVYRSRNDGNDTMYIPEEMEFPRRLRLLDWVAYPSKSLPPKFNPEYLVEIRMQNSNLEKLWEGTQPLKNLKEMDLSESFHLKELPDLSNATKLDRLILDNCESLVEIPSSFSHLQKLRVLGMDGCKNLQVIPADMNLKSLECVYMQGCSRLRNVPAMSTNIKRLWIAMVDVEEVSASISLCSSLESLDISGNGKLKELTHLPTSLGFLDLSSCDIEKLPDCMKALQGLYELDLTGCKRLASLPELPASLDMLEAGDCESLETVFCPFNHSPNAEFTFTNCFRLSQQSRREIIRRSYRDGWAILPGREVPAEFSHRARGNSVTIRPDGKVPFSASTRFKFCLVVSPYRTIDNWNKLTLQCRYKGKGDLKPIDQMIDIKRNMICSTEHLFVFSLKFPKMSSEAVFEFISTMDNDFDVIECGVSAYEDQVSNDWDSSGNETEGELDTAQDMDEEGNNEEQNEREVLGKRDRGESSWMRDSERGKKKK